MVGTGSSTSVFVHQGFGIPTIDLAFALLMNNKTNHRIDSRLQNPPVSTDKSGTLYGDSRVCRSNVQGSSTSSRPGGSISAVVTHVLG